MNSEVVSSILIRRYRYPLQGDQDIACCLPLNLKRYGGGRIPGLFNIDVPLSRIPVEVVLSEGQCYSQDYLI